MTLNASEPQKPQPRKRMGHEIPWKTIKVLFVEMPGGLGCECDRLSEFAEGWKMSPSS